MNLLSKTVLFSLIFLFNITIPYKAYAKSCSDAGINVIISPDHIYNGQTKSINVTVNGRLDQYKLVFKCQNGVLGCNQYASYTQTVQKGVTNPINDNLAIKLGTIEAGPGSGNRYISIYTSDGKTELCVKDYHINRAANIPPACNLNFEIQTAGSNKDCFDLDSSAVKVYSTDVSTQGSPFTGYGAYLQIGNNLTPYFTDINNGSFSRILSADKFSLGDNSITLKDSNNSKLCSDSIPKIEKCEDNEKTIDNTPESSPGPLITLTADTNCPDGESIRTALGCIPYEPVALVGWVLRWGIGIGGGIAFLLMAFASFQLMTSTGDPEKIKAGQEMFVSAGAGLLFIIFSVFLLQLIGADILKIPGFGR